MKSINSTSSSDDSGVLEARSKITWNSLQILSKKRHRHCVLLQLVLTAVRRACQSSLFQDRAVIHTYSYMYCFLRGVFLVAARGFVQSTGLFGHSCRT